MEPWSAEDPALYTAVISVYGSNPNSPKASSGSCLLDRESCQVGFRDVRVAHGELLVNGKAIMVAGVNRHDHDPDTGKTVTLESLFNDVALLKRFNFNAIRTSHYPNTSQFYDVCDALGM